MAKQLVYLRFAMDRPKESSKQDEPMLTGKWSKEKLDQLYDMVHPYLLSGRVQFNWKKLEQHFGESADSIKRQVILLSHLDHYVGETPSRKNSLETTQASSLNKTLQQLETLKLEDAADRETLINNLQATKLTAINSHDEPDRPITPRDKEQKDDNTNAVELLLHRSIFLRKQPSDYTGSSSMIYSQSGGFSDEDPDLVTDSNTHG
ncbi:BA75_02456T0 [Komagataella pastoris]|uniref:BA75_02456T0 n=1 Tax=Komagataella pastoris TaxID=4922 RepID=A0A1B2JBD7_PICPA|nr:BA75_02456T0 [Komagataella pastoris]